MTPDKDQLKHHIHKSDLTGMEKRYLEGLVDGEHVRHGRWRGMQLTGNPAKLWRCSECSNVAVTAHYCYECYLKYCPTCGAKMDKEVSE